MSFSRPIQCYHSHADSIWPDGTFKHLSSMPVPVFFENIFWGFHEYLDVYVLAVLGHTAGNVAIVILHVSACDKNIVNFMQVKKSAEATC